ncbi:serine/threonine protein phosphatase [hydrothermal vent metagenome]|uniref:Serine/threonine protein phosphatase n=1 Tax=hydrothermal vent metagenome TaxID=652676 RepID=A0A1W1BRI8_9ZZZZ
MEKHCVIGDIHGEYYMLLDLVARLPKDAKLIFVGDLVNRGLWSHEVVKFVREKAFATVLGNHEFYLLKNANMLISSIKRGYRYPVSHTWLDRNCSATFRSYGLLKEDSFEVIKDFNALDRLKDDIDWLLSQPLYIEMGEIDGYNLPVVISHGSIGDFWHLRGDSEAFRLHMFNRSEPSSQSPIFNIHGHKTVEELVAGDNFINLDTGCGKRENGKLTAYCIETGEIFETERFEYVEDMVA